MIYFLTVAWKKKKRLAFLLLLDAWWHIVCIELTNRFYLLTLGIKYAEPNYILRAQAMPDDPRMGNLWGMTKIEAPQAWEISTGNRTSGWPTVCVIDSGVDGSHPDLKGRI